MKFLLFATLLLAASMKAEAKPLAEAMHEFAGVWGLHNWALIWNVQINSDAATCALANELHHALGPAFGVVQAHPLGGDFNRRMTTAGVPWEEYKANEMKPALGYHALVSPCPTSSNGGVDELRRLLLALFHKEQIEATAFRLRSESSEFNEVYTLFEHNQPAVTEIRCHAAVQAVLEIYLAHHFDYQMIVAFAQLMFNFEIVGPC